MGPIPNRRKFGDYAVFSMRSPFKPADEPGTGPLGAYQEGRIVFDCKRAIFAVAETTNYNKAGDIISHFKQAEPEALNVSAGTPVPPGSVLSMGARVACDESLATSLAEQVKNSKLTYLSGTATGDGDIFYGPAKKLSESPYHYEVLTVVKLFQDHSLTELFPVKPVLNSPQTYRSYAQVPKINCTDRKALLSKTDNFDSQGNLVDINLAGGETPFDVKQGTVLGVLFKSVCDAAAN